jgi:hypothetical protein
MGNCNFKTENETDNVAGKYLIRLTNPLCINLTICDV